jgi:hypothetical protein
MGEAEDLVRELAEALKAAEVFIYRMSGGGETDFRKTLLDAIEAADAYLDPKG